MKKAARSRNRTTGLKVGVLGAGQLGRMMALEGIPLGMQFAFYDTSGAPSAGLGKIYSDPDNSLAPLSDFINDVDVVTYEFEHLPLDLANQVAATKPLYPGVKALRICQNRVLEKQTFESLNIPTAPFRVIDSQTDLEQAVEALGLPCVLKSTTEGYDGKGQAVLRDAADIADVWRTLGERQLIAEAFIPFQRELSIIAVRAEDGTTATYPLMENIHCEGILRYTIAPAPDCSSETFVRASDYAERLLNHLDYVGVLALELFEVNGSLMANEMAPRVHNSGHWTQNGAHTSQFENHLRAVSGLPLGDTGAIGVSCMVNLIGQEADTAAVLTLTDTHLHLYGKSERPGRKVGHINIVASDYAELMKKLKLCLPHVPDHPAFSSSLISLP
ncbi:5-(carboxyamino)imidazole ribonucleotide synthase [Allohahella sp. A8]|uniref:5-(carboxyamino)imidazole ribonucleotide synthase n=1 Tax=Allohahella sp. A8 TaxID=3141461 RepID=UPI003A810955